jgi:hypothetical protein
MLSFAKEIPNIVDRLWYQLLWKTYSNY